MAVAELERVASLSERILDEVERAVVGKRDVLELVLLGLPRRRPRAARGLPGPGQDADRALVRAGRRAGVRAHPVHARPDALRRHRLVDLQPARRATSSSGPGPIFANLLLGDEINRAPPKTQAALLEAMQERQVTIEGHTHPLERPFLVIATQNPIEYEGTYPLPEAQLDRFILRIGDRLPGRAPTSGRCSSGGSSARWTRSSSAPSSTARRCSPCSARVEQVHVAGADRATTWSTSSRRRGERARAGRREPARLARAAEALALPRGAPRPRLRHARRREGGRRAGARAPPDAPARALGAARQRRRRRAARRSRRCRRRPPKTSAVELTRTPTPKLGAYAGLAALGLLAALVARPAGAGRARGAVRARRSARGSRCRDARAGGARSSSTGSARSRARIVTLDDADLRAGGPIERLDLRARRCRRASRSRTARTPSRCGFARARSASSSSGFAARAGARTSSATCSCARTTASASSATRAALDVEPPLKVYPARRELRQLLRAARDAGLHRQPGRARERRGDRVRRPRAVRARRPRAADQLACERAARRAVGQRAAPRAEHRRHPLPRHLRGGARENESTLDLAVRAAAALADRYLEQQGPRRPGQLRRRPQLAAAGDRA